MDKNIQSLSNLKKLAFFFDQTKCGACNACTVACKDWNQVNPGPVRWRVQFTFDKAVAGGTKRFFPLSLSCNHCDEPACLAACSLGAITKDEVNGIVTIDRAKCQNLQACIKACPFAKPMIADDKQEPNPLTTWQVKHPAQKCTMCADDRLSKGIKPACVLSCLGRALDHGSVEYITSTYPDAVRLNSRDFDYTDANGKKAVYINNTDDTGPNLYIRKMPDTGGQKGMKIWKSTEYTGKY